MTDARLTVIIPTYNRVDLLRACLASLQEQTFQPFDVLVVDDGSQEEIKTEIGSEFPSVRVLRLSQNSGFASAVNAGLRKAQTELVMLLNNDMTLDSDCIEKMVYEIDETSAAMVAPLVVWKDDPDTVYSVGDLIRTNGRPESIGFRCARESFKPAETVFSVSAGAAIYTRTVFDTVGLFDERFVAYFEDADLCFRARLAGFEAACVPEAVAYHVGSASQEGKTWWRSRQCYRNHAMLVWKNMPLGLLLKYAPEIMREHLHQAGMLVSSARTEFGLAKALFGLVTARFELLTAFPAILRNRWRIQRLKRISNAELEMLLTRSR